MSESAMWMIVVVFSFLFAENTCFQADVSVVDEYQMSHLHEQQRNCYPKLFSSSKKLLIILVVWSQIHLMMKCCMVPFKQSTIFFATKNAGQLFDVHYTNHPSSIDTIADETKLVCIVAVDFFESDRELPPEEIRSRDQKYALVTKNLNYTMFSYLEQNHLLVLLFMQGMVRNFNNGGN